EGDSAGGSAKAGRDRNIQAILPLKGKILNVEKARFDKMLSNEEIRTIITALGCGIGKDEMDPAKLRYHKIIIMTDADVDGSHIRTLLLTFFHRQMPFLADNDYLYIAQPPLYKVKKKKVEKYLADDEEMEDFIFNSLKEGFTITPKGAKKALTGDAMIKFLKALLSFDKTLGRIEQRRRDRAVVSAVAFEDGFDEAVVKGDKKINKKFDNIKTYLKAFHPDITPVEFTTEEDKEHGGYIVTCSLKKDGASEETVLDKNFLCSPDFMNLKKLGATLRKYGEAPFQIEIDGAKIEVSTYTELINEALEAGKKGLNIQRYKALGEMNPSQLWETTMDPEKRTLMKVKVDDPVEADEVFTRLMGDQVEPRREFIEKNALAVSNLDI
ncbi:MAG: DNA gyrase subunit B, partial [Deltaproteobacteria bacterium]|nr:DNA gyrase subunit B [Deltaproteobacteria bacterium]